MVGGVPMIEWIVLIVVVVLLAVVVLLFNGLVGAKNRVKNAWSQVEVQLKRRMDLIPNLIETVKGYAAHEKSVFENVTKARAAMLGAGNAHDAAVADNMLSGALKSLFAVAEAYPDLKANANFLQLQEELSGTESKIAYARQFYNDSVMEFNNKVQMVPNNMIAGLFGFKEEAFFDAPEIANEPPKVKF